MNVAQFLIKSSCTYSRTEFTHFSSEWTAWIRILSWEYILLSEIGTRMVMSEVNVCLQWFWIRQGSYKIFRKSTTVWKHDAFSVSWFRTWEVLICLWKWLFYSWMWYFHQRTYYIAVGAVFPKLHFVKVVSMYWKHESRNWFDLLSNLRPQI